MHRSSIDKVKAFADAYLDKNRSVTILDVGSKCIGDQPHHRWVFEQPNWSYTGLDLEEGENVDLVIGDPYAWREIADKAFDCVVSVQVFEHIRYPWLTMREIHRVLKQDGLLLIVAPSSGPEHKYPYDCWRFYPDGLRALCDEVGMAVAECYTQWHHLYYADGSDKWHDSCIVARKGSSADNKEAFAAYERDVKKKHGIYPFKARRKLVSWHLRQAVREAFSLNR